MEKYGKTDLITEIAAGTTDLTRAQVATVIDATLNKIQQRVGDGKVVTIPGFGTWQQTQRQARTGVNIRTKQTIQIPASTSVRWSPGSTFKAAVDPTKAGAAYAKERAAGNRLEERGAAGASPGGQLGERVRQKAKTRGEKRRG